MTIGNCFKAPPSTRWYNILFETLRVRFWTVPCIFLCIFFDIRGATWTRLYYTTANSYAQANAVCQAYDGGYIVGCVIDNKATILKLDSLGNNLWQSVLDTSSGVVDVKETRDKGQITIGVIQSKNGGPYYPDAFLWKTDSTGRSIWSRRFHGGGAHKIFERQQGGYTFCGAYWGDSGNEGIVPYHGWIVTTDDTGGIVWSRVYGADTTSQFFRSFISTNSEEMVLTGWKSRKDTTTIGWVIKTDNGGSVVWEKEFSLQPKTNPDCIAESNEKSFVLAGRVAPNWHSYTDMFLMKIDLNGTMIWTKTFGFPGRSDPHYVTSIPGGGYLIAGDLSVPDSVQNMAILKTDSVGNLIWQKTDGGLSSDILLAGDKTSDMGHVFAGYSCSYKPKQQSCIVVVKIDSAGHTEKVNVLKTVIKSNRTYSNGSYSRRTGRIIFDRLPFQPQSTEIYDSKGRRLPLPASALNFNGCYQLMLECSYLPRGVYFIRFISTQSMLYVKFLITD